MHILIVICCIEVNQAKYTVNLVYFNWQSTLLNNYVAYILLTETLGYPATIKADHEYGFTGDTTAPVFQFMANET